MRRIVFIVLSVVVAALVGFFCWREFLIPEINFVGDFQKSDTGNHLTINRLYAAEVDHAKYDEAIDSILNLTEYTEEERFQAAIASGIPEFYPSFNFIVHGNYSEIKLRGYISIEIADNQPENRFKFGEIGLEVDSPNLEITEVNIVPYEGANEQQQLTKIHTAQQAAADISNASSFEITMEGGSGTVTLQLVYSVQADTFLPKTMLTEQVIQIHAEISTNDDGTLNVEFIKEPYSNLEELNA